MKTYLSRTNFNSSRLVRLLADFNAGERGDARAESRGKPSFAERLGQWLDLNHAIALSGALHPSLRQGPGGTAAGATDQVAALVARAQAALRDAITQEGGGKARIKLPVPEAGATLESGGKYLPYRRYYLAQQREMEAALVQLRAQVREALKGGSPSLRQLAGLDGVLEKALAERERNLFLNVPLLLEKRFEQLRDAYASALEASSQADGVARWMQPGGWLAVFCKDLQSVLLAELEIRLQPVLGLVEAFGNEVSKSQ